MPDIDSQNLIEQLRAIDPIDGITLDVRMAISAVLERDDVPEEVKGLMVEMVRLTDEMRDNYRNLSLRAAALEHEAAKWRDTAMRDPLLGASTRRAFAFDYLARVRDTLEKEGEDKKHFVVMLDLDHFKSVNDTYGHKIGDDVLKSFYKQISGSIGDRDKMFRWGGEEFLLLLEIDAKNEKSPEEIAKSIMERLKSRLHLNIVQDKEGKAMVVDSDNENMISGVLDPNSLRKITFSAGVNAVTQYNWIKNDEEIEAMKKDWVDPQALKDADAALYRAKEAGRDRFVMHEEAA